MAFIISKRDMGFQKFSIDPNDNRMNIICVFWSKSINISIDRCWRFTVCWAKLVICFTLMETGLL